MNYAVRYVRELRPGDLILGCPLDRPVEDVRQEDNPRIEVYTVALRGCEPQRFRGDDVFHVQVPHRRPYEHRG